MSIIKKIRKHFTTREKPEAVKTYYKLSPTCQIPNLQKIYEQYFGQRCNACFVEVGAFDGEYASNTSGLADMGWIGFYIEPVPEYYQKCKNRHDKNKNISISQYAIGPKNEKVTIHVGGPLSTIKEGMKKTFESLEWARGSFEQRDIVVDQIPLEDFLVENEVPVKFELLVIDVEGYEWDVISGFNIQKWLPQMVIIELHDQNDDYLSIREECNNIVRYFDANNYKVIFKDFTNTIYVPKSSYPLTTEITGMR